MRKAIGWLLIFLICSFKLSASIITTLNNSDPVPLFNSFYPYSYLCDTEKAYLKGKLSFEDPRYFNFSVSPFYQKADKGKNANKTSVPTGDLSGRWNLLALMPYSSSYNSSGSVWNNLSNLYDIPSSVSESPLNSNTPGYPIAIQNLGNDLMACIYGVAATSGTTPTELKSVQGMLSIKLPEQLFGFFSVPIEYRKKGVRFTANARFGDFGVAMQTGVAEISQMATYLDQTTTPTSCLDSSCISSCATGTWPAVYCINPWAGESNKLSNNQWRQVVDCLNHNVMRKFGTIAQAVNINTANFNKTSMEDLHIEAFWRHPCQINTKQYRDGDWPSFLFVPFISAGVSIGTGDAKDQDVVLSLPFGNNSHNAVRCNAGFTFDFYDSFEIGMSGGFTHFKDKNFDDFRLPNNEYQCMLYPFKTEICYAPGNNWHLGFVMNAYRFSQNFSGFVEFLYVSHSKDKITLLNAKDIADQGVMQTSTGIHKGFQPETYENMTPWSVQVIDAGVSWAASPNFIIGIGAQFPLDRKRAYKSTTGLLSLELTW